MTMEAASLESSPFVQWLIQWVRSPDVPAPYILSRWLFLRLLGIIYFFAFVSWWMQVPGLIGSHGVAPLSDYLAAIRQQFGAVPFWQMPTLTWLNSSDGFLNFLCAIGTTASILVILDIVTVPALAALWVLYLAMVYAGQAFMSYQWDSLLLEVGFLAIFLAPVRLLPSLSGQRSPSRLVIWLFRFLLFRLLFESGYVKLASGDPTWRNLTATTYHYWTQPLPSPLAWYMSQLPVTFHKIEVLFTFFVELVVPFLIFAPRRIRYVAAGLIALLQLLILLTGNYTFFNFLTIALCVFLLDDGFLRRMFPRRIGEALHANIRPEPAARHVIAVFLTIAIAFLNVVQLGETFTPELVPSTASYLAHQLDSLFIVNGYGLFATMTPSRPEIIIEGSADGKNWLPYEFKYKAGALTRSPAWVEPLQPRLDWQMWFAAQEGSPDAESWFRTFVKRLVQGTPEVLALLDRNPFPDQPPRYIRAELYEYTFTDAQTRQATGQWWQRKWIREFLPPVPLDEMAQ